jgi:hypothetical protein
VKSVSKCINNAKLDPDEQIIHYMEKKMYFNAWVNHCMTGVPTSASSAPNDKKHEILAVSCGSLREQRVK